VVITASIFIYQIAYHTLGGFARERRARAFIGHSESILSLLQEAESGQRGYLLMGEDAYLLPYHAATNAIPKEVEQLFESTTNPPLQLSYLKDLRHKLAAKLAEMDMVLAQYKSAGLDSAVRQMETDDGRHLMTGIRGLIHAVQRMEGQAVGEIETETGKLVRHLEILAICAVLTNLIGLGVGLSRLVSRMQELEELIMVCAWTKRVNYRGEWVDFEEYLKRHFGLRLTHGLSEESGLTAKIERAE
jgi:CHASE3 domain sensor protein